MYSLSACLVAGASWTVEFLQQFGPLPNMVATSLNLANTGTAPVTLTVGVSVVGTKENVVCSNRGICDYGSGICGCSTNFDTSDGYNNPGTRGDCGYAKVTIQFCPGSISCSAHGECAGDPTYACKCFSGWTGADCSERICPLGVSWFTLPSSNNVAHLYESVECSDMGICDRTSGTCVCTTGFSGTACELWNCPGTIQTCNGYGQCLDMYLLAAAAKVNGVKAGFTYGVLPFNPPTWDAFKMQGCLCDAGYTGYDCTLLQCAFGDDPITVNQLDEQQTITCTDSSLTGTVVLTFREYSTTPIAATATTSDVKAALQALPSAGIVSVETWVDGAVDSLCLPTGSQFLVTFKTIHGALPLITHALNNIDSFNIVEYVQGTKEYLECSGRGLCNRVSGVCSCFEGFGFSDGMGNMGTIHDCAFQEPILQQYAG